MGIIAKYKFNQEIYADFVPEFNSEFTDYTITDEIDTDGYTIRTIESDNLPTLMKFGVITQTDREKSLLEVYECNTENITSMSWMFMNCSSLTSLNVSNFNTEKVTNMNQMFQNCSSLTSLDISNFNTEKVTDMGWIVRDCPKLTDIGMIYCNSSAINKILDSNSITTNTTIWYQDANLSDLTQLDNITYKKYQSTTLSLNEPIQLRSIGDVHDEINYETGEYIQRIGEVVFDGSEDWQKSTVNGKNAFTVPHGGKAKGGVISSSGEVICDKNNAAPHETFFYVGGSYFNYLTTKDFTRTEFKQYLQSNPTTVQYQLAQPIITKIDTTILDQNNSYKSSQQTYNEQTYVSVQSDTVVTPTSSVDYEIYSSTGTVNGTSATIENAEAGTPVSGVVYGETLLNVIQEPSEDEYVIIGDNFEEQSGTLENTVEGNIKSVVLKGNTLVNHKKDNVVISPELFDCYDYTLSGCKSDTDYLIKFNAENDEDIMVGFLIDNATWSTTEIKWVEPGNITVIVNSGSTPNYLRIRATSCENLMIIEYQDGMENWDIPYFEGMQSVNLYPDQTVLKTIGKNLFDGEFELGTIDGKGIPQTNADCIRSKNFIRVSPNTKYVFSNDLNYTTLIYQYDINKNFITGGLASNSVTTQDNTHYLKFRTAYGSVQNDFSVKYQLEIGATATPYEPYKSNILSVNEEVHLRKFDDVQDELNLLTGKLTQRVGGVVLNGSENWEIESQLSNDEYIYFKLNDPNTIKSNVPTTKVVNVLTNKLKISSYFEENSTKSNSYFQAWTNHFIGISRTELSTQDVVGFKKWLSNNNISIQYLLPEESIKIIDLSILDQDDKPTDNLHTFDTTTHINTYAQGGGLIPFVNIPENISYDTLLKANTQYTIKLNRTNIVEGTPLTVNLGGTELSIEDGADSFTITTPSTLTNNTLSIGGFGNKVKDIMVIEGDYVDRDLDFFEGFISVENPILSTTGKNLVFLDKNNPNALGSISGSGSSTIKYDGEKQAFYTDTHRSMCSNIAFKPNTYYIISAEFLLRKYSSYSFNWSNPHQSTGSTYSSDTPFNETTWIRKSIKRLSNNNGKIGWIAYGGVWFRNLQIEEAESLTEYEPYQGNTLTTYPQITLRSMGDIKDELDVVGETVTRRIGKIVLDGSEEIRTTNNGVNVNKIVFKEKLYYQSSGGDDCNYLMCDKLRCVKYSSFADRLYDFISIGTSGMTNYESAIFIKFNSATTVDEWKGLYSQITPITLYYQLETPTTESVRITPPNPQTSSASITIPTQLNHVEDTSDFLVWNPYKEHYVRYNYVEDGVVLDNYTWENLTDLNERQFVEFYNKRTYVDQHIIIM